MLSLGLHELRRAFCTPSLKQNGGTFNMEMGKLSSEVERWEIWFPLGNARRATGEWVAALPWWLKAPDRPGAGPHQPPRAQESVCLCAEVAAGNSVRGLGREGPVLGFAKGELWKAEKKNKEVVEVRLSCRNTFEAESPPQVLPQGVHTAGQMQGTRHPSEWREQVPASLGRRIA